MTKFTSLLIFLTLIFSNIIYAKEVKCKVYDVVCKTKNFVAETKEYQKKEWKSKDTSSKKIKKK